MNKNRFEISALVIVVFSLLILQGCAGSGPNILPSPDPGNTTGLPPAEPYQPPAQQKVGSLSFNLKTGWNAVTFSLPSPRKFTAVTMTYSGETKLLKDASPAWTQSTIRYLKGRAWVLLQTNSTTASFQPGGKYYIYSACNGVVLDFSKPFIQTLSPASGPPGTDVTISGINFGAAGTVTFFDNKPAEISSWSDTQVICAVPEGAETGDLFITAGAVQSNQKLFTLPAVFHVKMDGDDLNDGKSWETAVRTIQKGIDLASNGDHVLVADGTYTGVGNKNLDPGGKNINLESAGGALNCVINCEGSGRGFNIHSGESNSCTIEGFTITDARATEYGGGMYCESSSPTVANCIFYRNLGLGNSSFGGQCGPAIFCYLSPARFFNCSMIENDSEYWYGGGIFCYDCSPTLVNCNISNNHGLLGGGIQSYAEVVPANPVLVNCTIVNNTANDGSAIQCWSTPATATATLYNCIVWGNTISGTVTAEYCDIQGGMGGTGNINADPLFIGGADYRLQAGSPCVDTGNNDLISPGITTDLDGNPRIVNSIVDMGAYEKQ